MLKIGTKNIIIFEADPDVDPPDDAQEEKQEEKKAAEFFQKKKKKRPPEVSPKHVDEKPLKLTCPKEAKQREKLRKKVEYLRDAFNAIISLAVLFAATAEPKVSKAQVEKKDGNAKSNYKKNDEKDISSKSSSS